MLILHGSETVPAYWHVKESSPPAYCRVYYVRSGHVLYKDRHTMKKLLPDHLYVFPSTCPYEMEQDPSRSLNCFFMHIDIAPHLLSELLELPVRKGSFLDSLLRTMSLWSSEYSSQNIDTVINTLSDSLIAYLCKEKLLQTLPKKLAVTINYISEHVKEKISLDTLSSLCGYHTQYYIRLFCSHMGITPHQYLISYRMKLSLYALRTGKSVTETAESVGYPEVRNFIRAFKNYYGHSPSQIKKYLELKI